MSFGDNLIGIKTTYKSIQMKSKLEAKFAYFLDILNIKWQYEPKTFILSNGITYVPDFYLTELNMWIEVKGVIEEHNKEISRKFVEDNSTEMLLVSANEMFWFSMKEWMGLCEDRDVCIGKCSSCDSYFFCCNLGLYRCRKCSCHNGDHDVIGFISSPWGSMQIDFSDLESIKEGVKKYGVSI